jgi:hypothetical protein
MRHLWLVALLLAACDDATTALDPLDAGLCGPLGACACAEPPCAVAEPTLSEPVTVVPADDMPAQVKSQVSHNNLDLVRHDGRLFFAFRTAPNHFASPDTVLYVVSTTDQRSWRFEGQFHLGTDLREPRFLSLNGHLWLFFAVLGKDSLAFEPQGTKVAEWLGPGHFGDPQDAPFPPDFIPWRIHVHDGKAWVVGYAGGAGEYDPGGNPIEVHVLTSADGHAWADLDPAHPVILSGGVSETDLAWTDDGGLVAVGRNEAGDDGGFGSRVCRAAPGHLAEWHCADDRRKYDSPLMFRHGGAFYLIARRNVTDTGNYDLELPGLTRAQRQIQYLADYWRRPKRCTLWRVDPDALKVTAVLDLPSAGDTCFAQALPLDADQYLVYNYSSPFEKADETWLQGQTQPTFIYRLTLTLPPNE